jgi:hypothetical protein
MKQRRPTRHVKTSKHAWDGDGTDAAAASVCMEMRCNAVQAPDVT